jgi:hypothetical protein
LFKLEITFCVRGVISPLLSNLVLDELDRELERRGHRYLRYADDCNFYVRSQRAGQRVMEGITRFITHKLKLKVNETKSAVARPQERKFLGSALASVQKLSALSRRRLWNGSSTESSTAVSIATGWNEPVPGGSSPAEVQHLVTAHCFANNPFAPFSERKGAVDGGAS